MVATSTRSTRRKGTGTSDANTSAPSSAKKPKSVTSSPAASAPKMTKAQKKEARERARAAMSPDAKATNSKETKSVTAKKKPSPPKEEKTPPSQKATSAATSNGKNVTDVSANPPAPKQSENNGTSGATSKKVPVAKTTVAMESLSLNDEIVPNWEPVPELLMVKLQSDDEGQVKYGLETLFNDLLVRFPKTGRVYEPMLDIAVYGGSPGIILLLAKKWKTNESIQQLCFGCLRLVAATSSSAKTCITKYGGVEAVLNAMGSFPKSSGVATSGIHLLSVLAANDAVSFPVGGHLVPVWSRFLHEIGGLSFILEAMKAFPAYKLVQVYSVRVFYSLATVKECRNAMAGAGVVTAVDGAMRKHELDKSFQDEAKSLMALMFSK